MADLPRARFGTLNDNAGWLVCKNGNEWQDGNYGFTTRNDRVSAILNIGGKLLKLDQSVHGNDFWQTDFNTDSRSYRMSFNLPLDGLDTSTWVLKRSEKTP